MKLFVTDNTNTDLAQWDRELIALGGHVFHSAIWARYTAADSPGSVPRFFQLRTDGGELRGCALGFELRSSRPLMRALTGRLWFDALPVVREAGDLRPFLGLLEEHACRSGAVELLLGSFASPDAGPLLEELEFDLIRRFEFEFAMDVSEEQIFQALEYTRRKNIGKASRSGVSIQELSGLDAIRILRRMQSESGKRVLARGGPAFAEHSDPANDPVRILLEGKAARVLAGMVSGEPASAGLFACWNGLVYYMLSGHSAQGLKAQAPTLMLWEAIRSFRREGARRFNLGGCGAEAVEPDSPEHGVYMYKKGFGTNCLTCTSGRKVLRQTASKLVGMLRSALQREV